MNRIKIIIIFLLVIANLNCRIWIKEYTYDASELDSKVSSRTIALEQVKRLLLQEIGVFVKSELIVEESEVNICFFFCFLLNNFNMIVFNI